MKNIATTITAFSINDLFTVDYNRIFEKSTKITEIPFRVNRSNKPLESLEQKFATGIKQRFFAEMSRLVRNFSKHCEDKEKVDCIEELVEILVVGDEVYTTSNRQEKEENFLFFYATFLVLLEELEGTYYESQIDFYRYVFEKVYTLC